MYQMFLIKNRCSGYLLKSAHQGDSHKYPLQTCISFRQNVKNDPWIIQIIPKNL